MNNTTGSPAPARAFLVSEKTRQAYPLGTATLMIGRDSVNHVRFADPYVSRFHAEVRPETGGRRIEYTLHSMGAAGSTVDGARIAAPRRLADGAVIAIGDTTLRFVHEPLPEGFTIVQASDGPADQTTLKQTLVVRSVEPVTLEEPERGAPKLFVTISAGLVLVGIGALAILRIAGRH